MNTDAPLPILLSPAEQQTLKTLLTHVEHFDPGGFAHGARRLGGLLDDPARTGDDVSYSYEVVGPWGVDGAEDEASAVAEVRKARAEHWASGYGRDDRYHQIQARRTAHISFLSSDPDVADSFWEQDGGETIEVLDAPLSAVEEVENERRLAAGVAQTEALYAYLREKVGSRT